MNGALGEKWLRERLDNVHTKGSNAGEIWARFQRGGIFKKTCSLVIINNIVHFEGHRGSHAQEGAIEQLVIRTVSANAEQ